MKFFDRIFQFFQKLFGKEPTYLIEAPKEISNEIENEHKVSFMSEIKVADEKTENAELNYLLNELKKKNENEGITKDDLIRLKEQMDKNMNILMKKNQKQYEDIKRYGWELDAYKKSLKNESIE